MKEYIFLQVEKLKKKYRTSDPFTILEAMNVQIWDTPQSCKLKGFCFLANQTFYVSIHPDLPEEMRRIVAAHELGHIILHKSQLKMAMMTDYNLNNYQKDTEYEANLFAADLLISDEEVRKELLEADGAYYAMCSRLNITPTMMSYKLFSMDDRGYDYPLPLGIDSRCLGREA